MNRFNQLRAFPLTVMEIVQWALDLERLLPGLDPEAVHFVVDKMILGEMEYDKTVGIQNIIHALNSIERAGDNYQIKTEWPG